MTGLVRPDTAEGWNAAGAAFLPGHLGIEITAASSQEVRGRVPLAEHHFAPNGFVHAGSVVTLADTLCGYGTVMALPDGAAGFTTIELKSNFLGSAGGGYLECVARPSHTGRTTQVWDAEVTASESGKVIAVFRCTQMVLYPR
jgi:1,4-dihydroxy-2-naphthoyl-CoA hydrolase